MVVVGDGPAGCAAAVAATLLGRVATLVGRGRVHPRGTLELLSAQAGAALVELGWYAEVIARATLCSAVVSRWGGPGYVERSAVLEPGGLGWIVDRSWFDPLVRDLAGSSVVRTSVGAEARPAEVEVVVATGKHTPGRRRSLGPDQTTLSVVLPSTETSVGRLLIEVAPAGWWSALDDGSSLTVTYATSRDGPLAGRTGVGELWRAALEIAPGWVPSSAAEAVPRLRPARSSMALVEPGSLRVGDAALSVDPLSGHGLTLALEGGLRCLHAGYADWLLDQARSHEAAGLDLYATAGP